MPEETNVLSELDQIQQTALAALEAVQDEAGLSAWRSTHLGRSAPVMLVFSRLGTVPKDLRPQVGQKANQVRLALEVALEMRSQSVRAGELLRRLTSEKLDVTLPGRRPPLGRLHPVTQALEEICGIFQEMGFQIYR